MNTRDAIRSRRNVGKAARRTPSSMNEKRYPI
jgi:hypothetical protein